MESFLRVRSVFHGKHTLRNHPMCARDCGHRWEVELLIAGEEDPDRWQMPVNEYKILTELEEIAKELDGHDIDKMIKPAVSSTIGIAHWYYERLASRYDVREVNVWVAPNLGATLRAP